MSSNAKFYSLLAGEADRMASLLSHISSPTSETTNEAAYLLSQCADSIRDLVSQQTYLGTLRGIPPTPAEAALRKAWVMHVMPELDLE